MSRVRNERTKSADAFNDLVRGFETDQGLRVFIGRGVVAEKPFKLKLTLRTIKSF